MSTDDVIPTENVAVYPLGIFNITTPEPPFPPACGVEPLSFLAPPPPPPPLFVAPEYPAPV